MTCFPSTSRHRSLALALLGSAFPFAAQAQAVVSTLAGSTPGYVDGPALQAQFNAPTGVAVDAQGNTYVTDWLNHAIRKISAAGIVSNLAGSGWPYYSNNPIGNFAGFNMPTNLMVNAQGNLLVADTGNGSIRLVTPAGAVTTFAGTGQGGYTDGPATSAQFLAPVGLAQDAAGNVYVADADDNRIRRIDPAGNVTTLAGDGVHGHLDGPAATARFFAPQGIALDAAGNLYIADGDGNRIRKLDPAGTVSTYAGVATAGYLDGPAATARFNGPVGVAVDASGDVFVTESRAGISRIRRIEARTGLVSTVAGTGTAGYRDGPALSAQFSALYHLTFHNGILYVADAGNDRIRLVTGLPLAARPATAPALPVDAFPNPVAGRATFRYVLPRPGPVRLTLYDAVGRRATTVLDGPVQAAGPQEVALEATGLPAGLYTYRLTTAQGVSVGKFIKE